MTLRRVVKSGNVVRLTPITRIGSNIRGSIESTLATDAAGAREKVRRIRWVQTYLDGFRRIK